MPAKLIGLREQRFRVICPSGLRWELIPMFCKSRANAFPDNPRFQTAQIYCFNIWILFGNLVFAIRYSALADVELGILIQEECYQSVWYSRT